MLLLASTSDLVQVVTSAAGQVDVHASYVDYNPSGSPQIVPGRVNTNITTAATTTIVGSPAAGVNRNVKVLWVGNNSPSVTNTVSIQHTDGTRNVTIEQVTLAPAERISYVEDHGVRVFDVYGREKSPNGPAAQGAGNTADITCSGVTETALASIFLGQRIRPGSGFLFRGRATKTAAGTAGATISLRQGPTGTVSDQAVTTINFGSQTAVIDDMLIEMGFLWRSGPVGLPAAPGAWEITLNRWHTVASGGMDTNSGANVSTRAQITGSGSSVIQGTADFATVTCNVGTAVVWTWQEAIIIPFGIWG